MKIRYYICLLIFSFSCAINAQTTQKGIVKEYNEKAQKTPLAGVEIKISSANSTISDNQGNFSLNFKTLISGDRIPFRNNGREIVKKGYEIFNKDALEQWNVNPKQPFIIIMCRSDRFKAICDKYYYSASTHYKKQYDKEIEMLDNLKKSNKLKDEEYSRRLVELEDNYNRQLDKLDNYVDRFARIDCSDLQTEELEIIELIQNGRFEDAINKYEELNISESIVKIIRNRDLKETAIKKLSESILKDQENADKLYEIFYRQIETLFFSGERTNILSAIKLLQDMAIVDPKNVVLQIKVGNALIEYIYDLERALECYNRAYINAVEIYGESSQYAMASLYGIARIHTDQGNYDLALDYYEKSKDIILKLYGKDDPYYAAYLNNIGIIYNDLGNYNKAISIQKQAISIKENILGLHHPDVAYSYLNIGSVYANLCDYNEALVNYKKALKIRINLYGQEHPDVAITLANIGNIARIKGNYSDAMENYAISKRIIENTYGTEHPMYATILMGMGEIYRLEEDYPNALEKCRECLNIRENLYGKNHLAVAESLSMLGLIYDSMEDDNNSLKAFEESLLIRESLLNEDHLDVGHSNYNVGRTLYILGEYSKALYYLNKAYRIYTVALGDTHPNTVALKEFLDSL